MSNKLLYWVHRISQVELRQQIDGLADEIKKISDEQQCPLDLESYVKKLLNAKRRVTVVSNILQVAQVKMRLEFLKITLSTTCIIF
jgi:SNARE-associated protein Snapin